MRLSTLKEGRVLYPFLPFILATSCLVVAASRALLQAPVAPLQQKNKNTDCQRKS